MNKNAKIMMLDERIKLLTARGSHNDKIVRKLMRQKRKLETQKN
jgi:uncharacterized protein YigA (DUF484 family)